MKKKDNNQRARAIPAGLMECLAAIGILVLVFVIIFCVRSCETAWGSENGIFEDTLSPSKTSPTTTVLTPIPADGISYPLTITDGVTLDKIYTATGYFPEDGSDEAMENVLAAKLTNSSGKTLEYLTFTLTVNGETYPFAAATVPGGKSVYVFNSARKSAPDAVTALAGEAEITIYFAEEPSAEHDSLSYAVQDGTVVVTNISDKDIQSDIVVYYKSTAENGYLGGITYRFRISGGLAAGKSFNAYAPHAYAHMTEIMFVQYEE